jgi:GT2 family glycosyltransferase
MRRFADPTLGRDAENVRYAQWTARHTPGAGELSQMAARQAAFAYRPLVSIITPVYNTDPRWLEACAASIRAQVYEHWEWHIGDDGSAEAPTLGVLSRLATADTRIHVHRLPLNRGISAASNAALAAATGDYVALMDHDDALLPHALFRLIERLNRGGPRPDVVYSDEDKLDLDGRRCDAYFKPDWSPDLFRSSMYACHLLAIRRDLVEAVGGFRSAFDFSQDYDLLLRIAERTDRIAHIPDVLYHWRKTPASTALAGDAKPAAHVAGARALQDHLDRQGIGGRILDAGPPGLYRVQYDIVGSPTVSIVMPTRDPHGDVTVGTLGRLARATAYRNYDVTLVSTSGEVPDAMPSGVKVSGVRVEGPFNIAAWVNAGAQATGGEHLLILHDDVQPDDGDWLQAMLELSAQPWIGAVGAKLFGPDGTLQHIGLILGVSGLATAPFRGYPADALGYYSGANCIRNYSAVSGACLMTRREVFDRIGGFDEGLPGEGADVDYGLKVCEAGLRIVFTPYARLTHAERGGVSGRRATSAELAHLQRRWGARLVDDPYYNRHLSRRDADYRVSV